MHVTTSVLSSQLSIRYMSSSQANKQRRWNSDTDQACVISFSLNLGFMSFGWSLTTETFQNGYLIWGLYDGISNKNEMGNTAAGSKITSDIKTRWPGAVQKGWCDIQWKRSIDTLDSLCTSKGSVDRLCLRKQEVIGGEPSKRNVSRSSF